VSQKIIVWGFARYDTWSKSHLIEYEEEDFYQNGGKSLCGVRIVMTEQQYPKEPIENVSCKTCVRLISK